MRQHLKPPHIALLLLILLDVFIWALVFVEKPKDSVQVSFLNVGQGDAILIEGRNGNQILIDGGPTGSALLRELGKEMSFFDRHLDVVIATHPDADHISGLVDLVDRYKVGVFLESGVLADTAQSNSLDERINESHVPVLLARRGMNIDLGDGSILHILFPDRDVRGFETNTASIIAKLTFGETSVMLTGDAPASIEEYVVSEYGDLVDSDVLKAGHHGSRTSTSAQFVSAVSPEVAIISAGKDNRYGHPHAEVIDTLSNFGAEIRETSEGTITLLLNGDSVRVK